MPKIAVLALQGDFLEHGELLKSCGAEVIYAKRSHDLCQIDGLVIPGGESTAIAKLSSEKEIFQSSIEEDIFSTIVQKAKLGLPIYGTCMGLIFLAKEIENSSQGRLALMDIKVRRNAFGSQKFSREENLIIPALGHEAIKAIFIRGPIILDAKENVEILARVQEGIVMAKQNNLLATAFHPELTQDRRVHAYFMGMVKNYIQENDRDCKFNIQDSSVNLKSSAFLTSTSNLHP